jgi:SAM-dependent MidA family methyltransferase
MNARAALCELIHAAGGSIPFERFMAFALHDPTHGYYARRIAAVGTRGDFTTAAEISPALAKAIAAWATTALKHHRIRHLIEVGPGNGTLAAAVWKNISPILRWRTQLHLVDSSSPLREIQRRHPALRRAKFHADLPSALRACGGNAIIYSNELLDAFPVRVLRHNGNTWQELHLTTTAQTFSEIWCDIPPQTNPPPPENHRIELPSAAAQWLQTWLPAWKTGAMLHIDYGHHSHQSHHGETTRRSPHGTLRGYLLHQRLLGSELYDNIGRADITADVDFAHLMSAAAAFTTQQQITTQAEFLAPHRTPHHPGDLQATDPAGAGTAFLVWTASA